MLIDQAHDDSVLGRNGGIRDYSWSGLATRTPFRTIPAIGGLFLLLLVSDASSFSKLGRCPDEHIHAHLAVRLLRHNWFHAGDCGLLREGQMSSH